MIRRPPRSTRTSTLFPHTTLFRSEAAEVLPAPVPKVAETPMVETPMVETAAVRPPEAFVPPTAEPLYGPVETVEPVEVAEAAETEPQEEVVAERSEERRVGEEGGSACRSRWSPYH